MAQLYKQAGAKRSYEIILIGYDDDQKAHEKYMSKSKMEWAGLKMSAKKDILKKLVPASEFLPNLVMMDGDGKIIAKNTVEVMKKLQAMPKG